MNDLDLKRLFSAVDTDGGGTVDGTEFGSWLATQSKSASAVTTSFFDQIVGTFVAASSESVQRLGWKHLFGRYDDDGSGELDSEVLETPPLAPQPRVPLVPRPVAPNASDRPPPLRFGFAGVHQSGPDGVQAATQRSLGPSSTPGQRTRPRSQSNRKRADGTPRWLLAGR